MTNLLSRKFLFAIVSVALSFYLVVIGKLPTNEWTTFVSIIGGTYITGNVVSKLIK